MFRDRVRRTAHCGRYLRGQRQVSRTPDVEPTADHFLADLEQAGFAPESIDTVLCTHLHVDHVGWNTRWENGRWLPTFVNARYLFGRVEYEHWSHAREASSKQAMVDSLQPVIDAGLVQWWRQTTR